MELKYIDAAAFLLVLYFLWRGYRTGLWEYTARLASHLIAIVVAIYAYAPLGASLAPYFALDLRIVSAGTFVLTLIVVQLALAAALRLLYTKVPKLFTENKVTRSLTALPALIDSFLIIILLVVATTALPISTDLSTRVSSSYTGHFAARGVTLLTNTLNSVTGGRLSKALGELTTSESSSGEYRELPFRPSSASVDEGAEHIMLDLVNEERARVGAPPLTIDPALTRSARLHSEDMWARKYFAHVNPDGEDPFDRMQNAGAVFLLAGENLALAPSTRLAHVGLMNSPGHRRNILDPSFRRVGIGVIDGGIYGKMYTQNFAN
ncbi:MAG TPA: CvpA family protein [Candidatus Paceibacterota bacterium]